MVIPDDFFMFSNQYNGCQKIDFHFDFNNINLGIYMNTMSFLTFLKNEETLASTLYELHTGVFSQPLVTPPRLITRDGLLSSEDRIHIDRFVSTNLVYYYFQKSSFISMPQFSRSKTLSSNYKMATGLILCTSTLLLLVSVFIDCCINQKTWEAGSLASSYSLAGLPSNV